MSAWAEKMEGRLADLERSVLILATSQPTVYPGPSRLNDDILADRIDRVCLETITIPLNIFMPDTGPYSTGWSTSGLASNKTLTPATTLTEVLDYLATLQPALIAKGIIST